MQNINNSDYSPAPGIFDATFVPDQLIAGVQTRVTDSITLKAGQGILHRGAVLGVPTAGGGAVLCTQSATDGSQTPIYVLASTYDTTQGDVINAGIYATGEFNFRALSYGEGWTFDTLKRAFRPVNIHIKDSVSAADPS
ncbi:head decoration protein [Entomobacter blattae]|uniref:Bacteriophage lambda head decoration protein D n=1 Tax=Entomobacter blattae TaxID=2762277 RepID=A0A7H1NUH5_9PROT|nr:head decoration protein [Entomobacter blattae]QNT79435.1 Bacteriophage lambda head decoration protein D [Entomobacter blattae]